MLLRFRNRRMSAEIFLPAMGVLDVRDACKSFGAVRALQGVSLELRERALLALLGPNRAGKTTLIRAIAGRVRLDGGEIQLFGRRLSPRDARHDLGIVPQEVPEGVLA